MHTVLYRPEVYRNYRELMAFLKSSPELEVQGDILSQIRELVKLRNPTIAFNGQPDLLNQYTEEFTKDKNLEEYGHWVYYPWLNKVVQTLPEEEFIEVRTNRNKYKITDEERIMLSEKKVGVVGLSVGQSVAVTMAMERVAGEIRLADFDILELSNYNRIRTGLQNLGLNKCISVAREIAQIDPFIKIKVFTDGLTEDNMDSFFHDGGLLDLVVEASDGLDIKVLSRLKARKEGVPVVMEASDRCILDVERFDLEPERPLLHGILGDLSVEKLRNLKTDEEKLPYMIDIGGVHSLSVRMKASLLEVSNTLTTWPQLASAVTLGGGVATDVIRRIFTKEFTDSGRYYVDVEDIISNKECKNIFPDPYKRDKGTPLTHEDMIGMARSYFPEKQTDPLAQSVLKELIEAAHTAPSGGNCQPWRWLYFRDRLYLFHDQSLSKSYLDYEQTASDIAFGAATENLSLKARQLGYDVSYDLFPTDDRTLVATFWFRRTAGHTPDVSEELANYIELRETNRNLIQSEPVSNSDKQQIAKAVEGVEGAKIRFFKDEETRKKIGLLLGNMERVRAMHPESHLDFANEIRWTEQENLDTRDGIDIATVDISEVHKAAYNLAMEPEVMQKLRDWNKGTGFASLNETYAALSDSFALITVPKEMENNFFHGGRALERAWLMVNGLGLCMQPQAVSVFLFNRWVNEKESTFGLFKETVRELRKEFVQLFEIKDNESEVFIFRLFKGEKARVRSIRRNLDEHMHITPKEIDGKAL